MDINNQPINTYQDWHDGYTTREIYRLDENRYEINDMLDGWHQAIVDKQTMQDLIDGKQELINLKWQ
jgi:hypothetical protein